MMPKEWNLASAMHDVLYHFENKPSELQNLVLRESERLNLAVHEVDTKDISNAITEIQINGTDVLELRERILTAIQHRDAGLMVICDVLSREGVKAARYGELSGDNVSTRAYSLISHMSNIGKIGLLIHILKRLYPDYF